MVVTPPGDTETASGASDSVGAAACVDGGDDEVDGVGVDGVGVDEQPARASRAVATRPAQRRDRDIPPMYAGRLERRP